MRIPESELILNPDGSIYHLHLLPGQIADTIITVGDTDRVQQITQYFDTIELTVQNREFKTQTGTYQGKRLTVISTGIGTDNIDIVFNELDALANIDFGTRKIKSQLTTLKFIRIGTSGSIHPSVEIDSLLVSKMAIGFDGLIHYYKNQNIDLPEVSKAFVKETKWFSKRSEPYVVAASEKLLPYFISEEVSVGITATNIGFYGPQGRKIRLELQDDNFINSMLKFQYNKLLIMNMEMETAGIYAISKLLGHEAISLNAILAGRISGAFSNNPVETINKLIIYTLDCILKIK